MVLKLYFIFNFICWVASAANIEGPCPEVKAVQDFDLSKYNQGTWYEIARYVNEIETRGDCVTLNLSKNKDGQYPFNITEILNGKINAIEGFHTVDPDPSKSGIMYLHSAKTKDFEIGKQFPVHMVAIDNNSYAIGYECRYDETTKTRLEFAWILSRSKKMEGEAKKAVEDFIKSVGYLDWDKMVWEHYDEESCKVKS